VREPLHLLLHGASIGVLEPLPRNRWQLRYAEAWCQAPQAHPLSVSMPLTQTTHPHSVLEPFVWNLMPDNADVLKRWGQRFQVSSRDPLSLLGHVGEDCAGAVQFVRPDRINRSHVRSRVRWLSLEDVESRLRTLRVDRASWRHGDDTGQFSLSGAQPKTALYWDGLRWGIPEGRIPTTHILKPTLPDFDGHAENEHICLALASAAGLPAAHSEVRHFGDEVAIVVTRYDRARVGPGLLSVQRIHQEDCCQALGRPPTVKYQSEGGPSPADIGALLQRCSSEPTRDVLTFVGALAFNWLIAGTDGHAKNYSLLHGPGGQLRLAPLYDIASALPYPHLETYRLKLAMKIGSQYRLRNILPRHWCALAEELGLDEDAVLDHIRTIAARAAQALPTIRQQAAPLDHPIVPLLLDQIEARLDGVVRASRWSR
jgi:serine/threonine-protein kinase HipA